MADLGASPFTITATANYTIPANVSTLQVECWGGGANGSAGPAAPSTYAGGGGGGGAYAKTNSIAVTPGSSYTFTVGAAVARGSYANANGNPSSMTGDSAQSCVAAGGSTSTLSVNGGAGGTTAASTGDTKYAGGAGGTGASNTKGSGGGGGGEGAGTGATGNNGGNAVGALYGAGGTGGDGGDGGRGGYFTGVQEPYDGTAPGGGGGGAYGTNNVVGGGAAGQIKVTYTVVIPATRSLGGAVAYDGSMFF